MSLNLPRSKCDHERAAQAGINKKEAETIPQIVSLCFLWPELQCLLFFQKAQHIFQAALLTSSLWQPSTTLAGLAEGGSMSDCWQRWQKQRSPPIALHETHWNGQQLCWSQTRNLTAFLALVWTLKLKSTHTHEPGWYGFNVKNSQQVLFHLSYGFSWGSPVLTYGSHSRAEVAVHSLCPCTHLMGWSRRWALIKPQP